MQQKLKAAELLKMDEEDIFQLFKESSRQKSYNSLKENEYQPFIISNKIKGKFGQQYEKIQQKGFNIEYPEPLDDTTLEKINDMKDLYRGKPLNQNFDEFINIKEWMSQGPETGNKIATAPLPPQPSPNAQVVQPSPQVNQGVLPNGLTKTETALLKPEEQLMRLNQRQAGPQQTGQV